VVVPEQSLKADRMHPFGGISGGVVVAKVMKVERMIHEPNG
jgi:hypothetical protein